MSESNIQLSCFSDHVLLCFKVPVLLRELIFESFDLKSLLNLRNIDALDLLTPQIVMV